MRLFALILFFMLGMTVIGGTVEWGKAFIVAEPDYSNNHDSSITIGAPSFLPTWGDRIDGGWRLFAITQSYMEYANSFLVANKGDVVDANYMASHDMFFLYSKFGDETSVRSDYYLDILVNDPIYVAFQNESASGVRYGWFQVGVDATGDLLMISSAWDVGGAAITIGAIPEPSSALLAMLGVAIVALQRRRGAR